MGLRKFIFLLCCSCCLLFKSGFAIDISRYRFHLMPETSYYGGIQSITKDSLGRMWYTGPDAVFMYDGNSFYQLNDLVSAAEPAVYWAYGTLITDKKGRLFLATNHGLLKFDYARFSFELLLPGKIRSVALHEDGNLYMLSGDQLISYHPQNKTTHHYPLPGPQYSGHIVSMKGHIYVFQDGLIYQLDTRTGRLVLFADFGPGSSTVIDGIEFNGACYFLTQLGGIYVTDARGQPKKRVPVTVPGNPAVMAKKIFADREGMIWVATQAGLFLYDPLKGSSSLLKMNLNDAFSLPNNSIWTIYADPDQGAWIGTYGGKIAYCSLYDAYVRYFNPSPGGLNHPVVSSFQEDDAGNIWIGTEGGGLNYWNRQDDTFRHFLKSGQQGMNSNMVKQLHFSSDRRQLLISTFNGGISAYDRGGSTFRNLNFLSPVNGQPLTAYDFALDQKGTWWMTDPDKSYLYKKTSRGSTALVKITGTGNKVLELQVEALYLDQQDNLRLITHQGLFIVDSRTLKVLKHYFIPDAPYSANRLYCYYQSSGGDLWLGTSGRGVNVLKKDGSYLNFNSLNGFPPKTVFGILEDERSKNIWLSTSEGLFYFDQQSRQFKKARFYQENSCGSFYIRAAYRTKKGELLFGGTNGFLLFDPAYLNKNPQRPRVFFTGLLINNQPVSPGKRHSPLVKDISCLSNRRQDCINLSAKETNLEIRFSSNSYLSAEKNQFAYRLLNLSSKWLTIPSGQRSVHFFNLPSGDYIFEIKTSNNDGLWGNRISRLYLHIDPPLLLSWWARIIYGLIILALLFLVMRYYAHKKVFKERLALEALKEQNLHALNQARTDFFTHISHDIKTPLTLVLEPLKQLRASLAPDDQTGGYLQLIERNIARIQRTITQLLRFREIESQKVTLNPQTGDFISFARDVFGLFELYANKQEIEMNFTAHADHLIFAFDYDVMEKILTNLFSNALKYTDSKGYVGVRIYAATAAEKERFADRERKYISIEILNSGAGFSSQQIDNLFTSFNRLSAARPAFEESSGLGLAIVKKLAGVIGGEIRMVNKADKISFTVTLPYIEEAGAGDLQCSVYDYTISEIDEIMLAPAPPEGTLRNARKASSVLLIENDPDMRAYLERRLSGKYNVYTAADGQEGITKAEKIYPQLIITDLMMPNCSGFEVCSHLRQNFRTSHIPIIMISGKGDENQHKIRALELGATVFIDKPFEVEYLLQQIGTILKNRQEMREMYSKRLVADPAKVTITSMDEELLIRAMNFIELNMGNPDYSVDDFVADMNTGRTILYQKINDIVGMSIKEFISNIRLKRSADLLEHSDLTIAEVAYRTGFNNAKYFSVCFKRQLGSSPSEFKKKNNPAARPE